MPSTHRALRWVLALAAVLAAVGGIVMLADGESDQLPGVSPPSTPSPNETDQDSRLDVAGPATSHLDALARRGAEDSTQAPAATFADKPNRADVAPSPEALAPGLWIVGRLLDPHGRPLQDHAFDHELLRTPYTSPEPNSSSDQTTTDTRGRFAHQVTDTSLGQAGHTAASPIGRARAQFRIRTRLQDHRLGADREIQTPLPEAGRIELGDVRLYPMQTVVTGRVVNDLDQPIEGAKLVARHQLWVDTDFWGNGSPPPKNFHAADLPIAETTSSKDGSFRLECVRGSPDPELYATAENHRSVVRELGRMGRRGLEIRLPRSVTLVGSVIRPATLPADALQVDLARTNALGSSSTPPTGDVHASRERPGITEFRFEFLDPGTYELSVRIRGLPDPVATVSDIQVDQDSDPRDPRAQNIPIRGLVHRYVVTGITADGGPATLREHSSPLLVETADGWRAFSWKDGRCEIFAAAPTLDVVTTLRGFRSERTTLEPGPTCLTLQPTTPARVSFPGLVPLLGVGGKAHVSMRLENTTGLPKTIESLDQQSGKAERHTRLNLAGGGDAWLDPTSAAEIPLVLAGRYRIFVRLFTEESDESSVLAGGSHDVRIDGDLPHQIVIELPRERVLRAVESLPPKLRESSR